MQVSLKNTRKWNIFAVSIFGLAIAVFAWGLKYKLSLYEMPPPSHHVMVAKLLSNRERPADTAAQIERATMPVPAVLFTAFGVFACLLFDREHQLRWTLQNAINPQRRPIPQSTRQIFFRPPPRRK
jgi:hypothetical protein